ncbi:MAG TPA: four helix bundle protein, partial [Candidatus Methylomirabilis sp.]
MTPGQRKARTKAFGLEIIAPVADLPGTRVAQVIGNHLLRSGTAIGSNYRAACRARSGADFRSKLPVVEEEADETLYWLEVLAESRAAMD